ncbi:hypothetical protein [Variovorax gossypii]|uniref:hypothetical protein n=1 Tax=uncultured Variovorax sp. TaxID=114708 RepID=UPI00261AA5DA|nr:hypothetical protein [uncultured Variovorax sp.]
MTAAASTAAFSETPLVRAMGLDASSAADPQLVHGANLESSSKRITLADAERVAMQAAEQAWKMSGAAIRAFVTMLMNLLRWMARPFKPTPGADADGARGGTRATGSAPAGSSAPADENSILDPKLDNLAATPAAAGFSGKMAPPSGNALRFKPQVPGDVGKSTLPVTAEAIAGAVERVSKAVPNLAEADAGHVTRVAAASVLDEQAAQLIALRAKAIEIGESMQSAAAIIAGARGWTVDQAIDRALADSEVGGDPGDAVRRLFREGAAVESQANECQAAIENSLNVAHAQGVDIAALVEGTRVSEALPGWQSNFDLKKSAPDQPPAPSAAELRSFAIVASSPEEGVDAPVVEQKGERLKGSLNLSIGTDEHQEAERAVA